MKDQFGLEENAMLNDPRSTYWPSIVIEVDGNMLFAHLTTFVNLQESAAGFGSTAKQAVAELNMNMKRVCHKAMWTGYGAPAGICGEPAYTDEIHANSLAMILCQDIGRCPKHGGLDLNAAAALALHYRTSEESRQLAADFEIETEAANA
jgi:hypothetical protein